MGKDPKFNERGTTRDVKSITKMIMRDVNNGWLIRYIHSNTASAFFFIVYLHIGRGLYYGSYQNPRTLVWSIGVVIFILMMATWWPNWILVNINKGKLYV